MYEKSQLRTLPLVAPLMFMISGLLLAYVDAVWSVAPSQILRPLVFSGILLALLVAPSYWLIRDLNWTGLLLAVLATSLFFRPKVYPLVAILMGAVLLAWCCCATLIKKLRNVRALTIFLAVGSSVFMLLPLWLLGRVFLAVPAVAYRASAAVEASTALGAKVLKPDVYYIVLDGYGRSDILGDYFSFDNSEFMKHLEARGFLIPQAIHSNYPYTLMSIASTLNMDYVHDFAPGLDDSPFSWQLIPFISHSRLRVELEHLVYETYATATDWDPTNDPTVDHYYQPFPVAMTEYEALLLNTTPLRALEGPLGPYAPVRGYQSHRAFVQNALAALNPVSRVRGRPKFVFVHILLPHPPFVFDANGKPHTPKYPYVFADANLYPGSDEEYRRLYIEQVEYLNSRVEAAIDAVLDNSQQPPIIILQADHGPRVGVDFMSPTQTCMRQLYSPFAAYFLPGLGAEAVPPNISPVNIFRIVLDRYFEADFSSLQGRSYFPNEPARPFQFEDVTTRIDDACALP